MANLELTRLVFLLDRSGSMQDIKSDVEGGFAAFIDEQRSATGTCTVTLAQFDTRPAIKALVEMHTNQFDWQFMYMGADQDAVEVGTQLGVQSHQSLTYSKGKSREAMAAASVNVRGYRNARSVDPAAEMPEFNRVQRAAAADD